MNILLILVLVWNLIYGYNVKQPNTRNVPQKAQVLGRVQSREIERQKEIKQTRAFLKGYGSPLTNSAQDFVDASYVYGLDYRLLPAIAGTESTFGKHTPSCAQYNVFGFTSTSSPCHFYRFDSYGEAIWKVAETLGVSRIYAGFREAHGSVAILAQKYNLGSQSWIFSVDNFMREI